MVNLYLFLLKNNMKKKSFFTFLFLLIIILYLSLAFIFKNNPKDFFEIGYKTFKILPIKVQTTIKLFTEKDFINNLNNDYNVKYLPETQYLDLEFTQINLNFIKESKSQYAGLKKTFFIDLINNKIYLTDKTGNIFFFNSNNINKNINNINNLKNDLNLEYVLDTYIKDNYFYISYVVNENNCEKMKISYAKINNNFLQFKKLFDSRECGVNIQGGKIQYFNFLKEDGILVTTGDNIPDLPSSKAQNDKSIFGKILFISLKSKETQLFSKGHRNPQGLFVKDKLILSTEHGPKGGDEINKINFNKNYGWPISSYGESYANDELKYLKSHESNGLEEPIYSFVPSVGISEIIAIPNEFSNNWQDNFLISTLNDRSLYRVKFDQTFSKIYYKEKIFIGQRIRDLKFDNNLNAIFLSLEDKGELGILKIKK